MVHDGPQVNISDEMKSSFIEYAMSVIISRAIPDLRDGLKPVHRRILYAMHEAGNTHDKAYRKSARAVGDVMGKYHPHGDGAIYDALVRMAQDFSMSLPLLDGQGNFGSMDGDNPAAMRYTEVRMDKPAGALLADIEKDTVDFQDNYDGKDQEPTVLPARFPNMLVNGAVPYQVNKATMIEKIAEAAREKRIEGIAHVQDESDRVGVRVVVELKRDATLTKSSPPSAPPPTPPRPVTA